jgi:hypothetical protein
MHFKNIMNSKKSIFACIFLLFLSNAVQADLKLLKQDLIPTESRLVNNVAKLIGEDGQSYVVTSVVDNLRTEEKSLLSSLRIENFLNNSFSQNIELDINHAPLFGFGYVKQQGVFAWMPMTEAIWNDKEKSSISIIQLNKSLTKVEKYGKLLNMQIVSNAIKNGGNYYVGGFTEYSDNSKPNAALPLLFKLNKNFEIQKEAILPKVTKGLLNLYALPSGNLFATVQVDPDGTAEIWELSSDLIPVKKIPLLNKGSLAVPLRDGGYAVLFSKYYESKDIFVERLKADGTSAWVSKLYTKAGGVGSFADFFELKNGFGLVSGNNDRLLVARISANGSQVKVTEDLDSVLAVPVSPSNYLVAVRGDEIHIRGVASNKNRTSEYSFYFIDTP